MTKIKSRLYTVTVLSAISMAVAVLGAPLKWGA